MPNRHHTRSAIRCAGSPRLVASARGRRLLIGFVAAWLCSNPALAATPNATVTTAELQKFLETDYPQLASSKAVAISPDGRFYPVSGLANANLAASDASLACLNATHRACTLYRVNNYPAYSLYPQAAEDSAQIIAKLPAQLAQLEYADENSDEHVAPSSQPIHDDRIATATPIEPPAGVKRITTVQLLQRYHTDPELIVIDALPGRAGVREGLPKARWLSGSGDGRNEQENALISQNLAYAMSELAPNTDASIVVYCAGKNCWHSWNAALRLAALGYRNVFWYRGGITAWQAALLPTIKNTPLAARLY